MKHATEKYNRIQDPDGIIPEDEPVFLIRAQDMFSYLVVRRWLELYIDAPDHDKERARQVREHLLKIADWPKKKVPGTIWESI